MERMYITLFYLVTLENCIREEHVELISNLNEWELIFGNIRSLFVNIFTCVRCFRQNHLGYTVSCLEPSLKGQL